MREQEEWRPVDRYESTYEVSSLGRVKSIRTGKVMKLWTNKFGYELVTVSVKGVREHLLIHREVLKAFQGPPNPGDQGLHWDGCKTNNEVGNLRWGTASENMHDSVRQGLHPRSRKTHCRAGHEYSEENTTYRKDRPNARICRLCSKLMEKDRRVKRAQQEPPTHGTINGYVSHKCRCADCKSEFSRYQKKRRAVSSQHPS